jgi:hypothetical protein
MAGLNSSHHDSQEAEKKKIQEGANARYSPYVHIPSDTLPPTQPYLLLFITSQ